MSGGPRPLLVAQVTGDEAHKLKFKWRYDDRPLGGGYSVALGDLNVRKQDVRQRLTALIKVVPREITSTVARNSSSWPVPAANSTTRSFLPEDCGNAWAEFNRNQVESLPATLRVQFEVEQLIQMPWGLIYDGDPETLPDDPTVCDSATYTNFWCLKYSLATIYVSSTLPYGVQFPIDRQQFRVLPFINSGGTKAAWNAVPTGEVKSRDLLLDGLKTDRAAFLESHELLESKHVMLYFLCHADGERLALGAEDLITLNDFRKIKPNRLDHRAGCLVFVNGCETAVGAADGGFLKATCRPGFYGFIGTETKVPDLYALRFGVEFLRELLSSRKPLYAVMDFLRGRHWPLSLMYSLYAYPLLSVESGDNVAALPDPGDVNFSAPPIGTGDL